VGNLRLTLLRVTLLLRIALLLRITLLGITLLLRISLLGEALLRVSLLGETLLRVSVLRETAGGSGVTTCGSDNLDVCEQQNRKVTSAGA
jgi:hypothetical protein